jgi:hypothetical protein
MKVEKLPKPAQESIVNGIVVDDLYKKGANDLILAGNFYPFRVQFGPLDAGIGMVLKSNDKDGFSALGYSETGLNISGDVRNLIKVKGANGNYWLIAVKNNEEIQVLKRNN